MEEKKKKAFKYNKDQQLLEVKGKGLKISLMMIVKDETDTLRKALESTKDVVDEIVVNYNGDNPKTEAILKEFKCRIYKWKWTGDFSEARNFLMDKVKGDLLLWLDADDVLVNPERIRESCNISFENLNVGAIWCEWLYAHDENGKCTMKLWRERIARRGWFKWVGRLHEGLIQQTYSQHVTTDSFQIKHLASLDKIIKSSERNFDILITEYHNQHDKKQVDSKTVLDVARASCARGYLKESIEFYKEYVAVSGYDDDRAYAYSQMANIYRGHKQWDDALNADCLCIKMRPAWPDGYIGLGQTMYLLERWNECIALMRVSLKMEPPYGHMPCDPTYYEIRPYKLMAYANFQLGEFDKAKTCCEAALKGDPVDKLMIKLLADSEEVLTRKNLLQAFINVKEELEKGKHESQLKNLLNAVPDYMLLHPVFIKMKGKYSPAISKNRMVIYCGPAILPWDPLSVKTGIGGSEEAVINMARRFTKMGYSVDVYNATVRPANYEGVEYHMEYEYDNEQPCDIFIAWRMPEFVNFAPKGSRVFLWLHDIQRMDYYNENIIKRVEKIFVLSKHHRTYTPDIPEEKYVYTRNGVDLQLFDEHGKVEKIPFRCFYASSPDRGLNTLLGLWGRIRKEIPAAELHIFYGFTKIYDELHKANHLMTKFKTNIMDLMKQPGIVYHGMVGHSELAKAMLESEFWFYPTDFEEISCITAMKAQIAGAIPIYNNIAALKETVKYGHKFEGAMDEKMIEAWFNICIDGMKNKKSFPVKEMQDWARKEFGWDGVAKQWHEIFKRGTNEKDNNLDSGKIGGKEGNKRSKKAGKI